MTGAAVRVLPAGDPASFDRTIRFWRGARNVSIVDPLAPRLAAPPRAGNFVSRWFSGHPRAADALLAAFAFAVLAGSQAIVIHETRENPAEYAEFRDSGPGAFALLAIMAVALFWRRTKPVQSLAVIALAALAFTAAPYAEGAMSLTALVGVYSLAAHTDRRTALRWGGAFSVALVAGISLAIWRDTDQVGFALFISNFIIFGTAWLIGDNLRNRRALAAHLRERAERAEADREIDLRQAVILERTRIAREMHDSIAHSISVMVVQAAAARRVLETDPRAAATAIEAVESTGRATLDEMRHLVGVLRNDAAGATERAPQPGIDDVALLVRQCREAGLPVELRVEGTPPQLSPVVGLSVYRIVQEGLTNVMKHAGTARASVALRYEPHAVHVEIEDDGRGAASSAANGAASGGGHGLVGMRERVEAFGGSLFAGPRPGGGFAVRGQIPILPSGASASPIRPPHSGGPSVQ